MPGIAINERISARLSQIASALRVPFRLILEMGLPQLCPSCRDPVGDGAGLCAACWAKLSPIERPFCEKLGIPFTYDPGPGIYSMQAIADPPAYARARAAVRYDEIAGTMVHALKYGDRLDLAPVMARWMARAGGELLSDAELIVPVPLHWRRMWSRRFNQSATLAKLLAKPHGLPVSVTALKRVRATPQQVGLSKSERAANVQGAFRVPPEKRLAVKGRRLVLIDDVLTTGATADVCTKVLLRAGALRVDVLVLARVVEPG
jgi:ComF family protein